MGEKGVGGVDFRFGKFNNPDEESMINISKAVKAMSESSGSKKKQKVTHSISSLSQTLIKDFADECGVTQGSIVELAPILFRMLAQESIERRKSSLKNISVLINRINSSLSSITEMAPHLKSCVEFIKAAADELYKIEEAAIEENNYKGVDVAGSENFSNLKDEKNEVAFHKEVKKSVENSEELSQLFALTVK